MSPVRLLAAVFALLALAGGVDAAPHAAAATPSVPPQLNTTSFARCLQGSHPRFSLPGEVGGDNLTDTDGLLVWLAVYAGERLPFVNSTLQQPAFERWGRRYWPAMQAMADALYNESAAAPPSSVTPGRTFALALEACASAGGAGPSDAFCASLVSHNVFRLLGRWKENVDKNGVDYSPDWFVRDRDEWVATRIPAVHAALVTIRRDNVTERWGSWYHTHGLLAYGLQCAGTMGVRGGAGWERLVVALDTLLNPILAGGKEDPVKAEIDKETVALAVDLVKLMAAPSLPPYSPDACASKGGYVIAPWWTG